MRMAWGPCLLVLLLSVPAGAEQGGPGEPVLLHEEGEHGEQEHEGHGDDEHDHGEGNNSTGEEGEEEESEEVDTLYAMGVTMIGILVLAMGFWYLVHDHDVDIRMISWKIISSTISIFCAVLIFTTFNEFFDDFVVEPLVEYAPDLAQMIGGWETRHGYNATAQHNSTFSGSTCNPDNEEYSKFLLKSSINTAAVFSWYGVMMLYFMWVAGIGKGRKYRMEIAEDEEAMHHQKVYFKVGLLFAHVTAFTGMHGWGATQNDECHWYKDSWQNSCWLILRALGEWFVILLVVGGSRRVLIWHFVEPNPIWAESLGAMDEALLDADQKVLLRRRSSGVKGSDSKDRSAITGNSKVAGKGSRGNLADTHDELVDVFVEMCEDGENDMYALFVGFLTVQTVRFAIGGNLPDLAGLDHEHVWDHDPRQTIELYACSAAFIVAGCLAPVITAVTTHITKLSNKAAEEESLLSIEFRKVSKRLGDVWLNMCTMTAAWCFMYATQWLVINCHLAHARRQKVYGEACLERRSHGETCYVVTEEGDEAVLQSWLSLLVTLDGFLMIWLLDKVADAIEKKELKFRGISSHEGWLDVLSTVPRRLNVSVALLIGFSWEKSMDMGIEGIAEQSEHTYDRIEKKGWLMFWMSFAMLGLILPAWIIYIMPMLEHKGYRLGVGWVKFQKRLEAECLEMEDMKAKQTETTAEGKSSVEEGIPNEVEENLRALVRVLAAHPNVRPFLEDALGAKARDSERRDDLNKNYFVPVDVYTDKDDAGGLPCFARNREKRTRTRSNGPEPPQSP